MKISHPSSSSSSSSSSFSFSPSSSSSSSSAAAPFDRNLCSSQSATAGCLSGVLRRLLCSGSLRTHPFDCMKEASSNGLNSETQKDFKSEEKMQVIGNPGLVARLMGLESMPDLSLVQSCRTPETIGRSRSVNSADYWSEFDPTQFRRVKSSLSFREMPTCLRKENDEFLVLSFDKAGETKELGSRGKKSEMGCRESKQNRSDLRVLDMKDKEDQASNKTNQNKKAHSEISDGNSCRIEVKDSSSVPARGNNLSVSETKTPLEAKNHKDSKSVAAYYEMKNKKKKKQKKSVKSPEKTVEPASVSENSSPVSVLDLDEFLNKTETLTSDEKSNSSRASSNSRRDLSSKLAKLDGSLSSFDLPSNSSSEIEESVVNKKKKKKSKQDLEEFNKTESRDHKQLELELWGGEACKLAEEETKESMWAGREMWKLPEFEEIGMELVLYILNKLVNDVSVELAGPDSSSIIFS